MRQRANMSGRLFTIICEFRGGTYASQVRAEDERHAVMAWTELLAIERPIAHASSYLAKSVAAEIDDCPPTALEGLIGVWYISGECGGDWMSANIIETDSR